MVGCRTTGLTCEVFIYLVRCCSICFTCYNSLCGLQQCHTWLMAPFAKALNNIDAYLSCVFSPWTLCLIRLSCWYIYLRDPILVVLLFLFIVCVFMLSSIIAALRPFHTTVECASKPDQTISRLNWIDCIVHSIWLYVNPPWEMNWPDSIWIIRGCHTVSWKAWLLC